MKRKGGGPIEEEEEGNGNPPSSRQHRPTNPKKNSAETLHDETAMSPLRVAAAAEEEEDKTARALLTQERFDRQVLRAKLKRRGFDPDNINKKVILEWTPMNYFSAVCGEFQNVSVFIVFLWC